MWGYWSRQGTFTLVANNDKLEAVEVSKKLSSDIRDAGGFLFDRELFAQDAARSWTVRMREGTFVPVGCLRVFTLRGRYG